MVLIVVMCKTAQEILQFKKSWTANSRGTFAGKARGTRAWKTSLKVLANHVTLLKTGRQKCVTKGWTRPWQFPQLQLVSLRTAWLTTQMWLCSGRKCVTFFFFSFWTWNRSKNTVTSLPALQKQRLQAVDAKVTNWDLVAWWTSCFYW